MSLDFNYTDWDQYPDDLRFLSMRPDVALQQYGWVKNLEDETSIRYDPYAITDKLQASVLAYVAAPPIDEEGYNQWLVICKSRQSGVSTTVSSAYYCKSQFTPGWEHVTSADKEDRAKYLFSRVNYLHNRWDGPMIPQITHNQVRAFHWANDSHMLVMTGGGGGLGIGTSASSWHWSEVPLWPNAAQQWSYASPAIINRKNAQMVFESTPFPLNEPSSEFFMELCESARAGGGRLIYSFEPFWDGKLNRRVWKPGDTLTNEEIRLLERYGKYGLRKENLAFRREIMDVDDQIKRNPDLFRVFYAFDDVTCWLLSGSGVIKARHLDRHLSNLVDFPHDRGFIEYSNPKEGAIYVIGVDPSGFGARDHAAFHVFEVWAGSWRQVAVYATLADPPEVARFIDRIGRKWNDALVLVERNGVGVGILTALIESRYPNLYYETGDKPGLHKRSEAELVSVLIDALNETFVLRDRDTVTQLRTYRSDRSLERTVEAEILQVGKKGGRRSRHHWDKVSALMMAAMACRAVNQRTAPAEAEDFEHQVSFQDMTMNDLMRYQRRVQAFKASRERRPTRHRYKSVRRRRK